MNTPNKDSTAQDTSDVDVAPASSSPKQEEDGDNESEKEMTTTTMAPENKEVQKKNKEVDLEEKMKEERDQCSICLEDLQKWAGFTRMVCCGNGLHIHCNADLMSTKMKYNCIL